MKIKVLTKLTRGAKLPEYATAGSAAADLRAALGGGMRVILPGQRELIPTGISIQSEAGDSVVAIVAGRSGLGTKNGICLSNGIGVIDSDYRGELMVSLFNSSSVPFRVNDGDRIAQLMFMPVMQAEFVEAVSLDETERGTRGFGSTGVQ